MSKEEILCPLIAQFRYTWPGEDESFICPIHAPQLQTLARVMGLHLQIIPLQPGEMNVGITCQQHLSPEEVEKLEQIKK